MIEILRTPEQHFLNLKDYPWEPNYIFLEGEHLRMHYLDEGDKNGELILLLHGEPSWSYLYRKMIPGLVAAGYRVIAPDLIGFGKSDKPVHQKDVTYTNMTAWLNKFVTLLDLQNITLFAQDWGGLLGLRVLCDQSERFSRLAVSNTFLPTGKEKTNQTLEQWKIYVATSTNFHAGGVIEVGSHSHITAEQIAAYDAPFPDESYKVAAKILPMLIPVTPDDPEGIINESYWEKLSSLTLPCITLFAYMEAITKGMDLIFQAKLPGAQDQEHKLMQNAVHFVQEDAPEELVLSIIAFCQANPI